MKTLVERLQETDRLTDTEKELAGFILEHQKEITALSVKELSERAFVSKASISRLCRKLGEDGYRNFQISLAKELEHQKLNQASVDVNFPFAMEDDAYEIARKMAALMHDAIRDAHLHTAPDKIMRAADLLLHARRIYYYAEGDSLITLTGFMNRLIKLGIFSVDIGHMREMDAILETVGAGDILLQITYSGTHTLKREITGTLRMNGCRAVLMTAKDGMKGFDLVVDLPSKENYSQDKVATYYSQISIEYLQIQIFCFFLLYNYARINDSENRPHRRRDRPEIRSWFNEREGRRGFFHCKRQCFGSGLHDLQRGSGWREPGCTYKFLV